MKKTCDDVFAVAISPCFDACRRIGDQLGWQTTKIDDSAYVIQWRPASSLKTWTMDYVTISLEPVDTSHTRVSFTYQNVQLVDPLHVFHKRMMGHFEQFRARLGALVSTQGSARQGPTCPSCGESFAVGIQFCPNDGTALVSDRPNQRMNAFCPNCGVRLSEKTKFCPSCGAAQDAAPQTKGMQVETCEIVFLKIGSGLAGTKGCFEAKAIGPNGTYSAGVSPDFSTSFDASGPVIKASNKPIVGIHSGLVDGLVSEGWEPTGDRGAEWWSQRFRRRIA